MTVEELQSYLEGCDPWMEVRLAMQPSWPFEYSIQTAMVVEMEERQDGVKEDVLFLFEGTQLGYLPSNVSREIGWKG